MALNLPEARGEQKIMRLTCPNCSARYEVDDAMVPPEGRENHGVRLILLLAAPLNAQQLPGVVDPTPAPPPTATWPVFQAVGASLSGRWRAGSRSSRARRSRSAAR